MGFIEVLMNLRKIARNFKLCVAQIKESSPDAIIFVDYPGFNLRMAKRAKKMGYHVIYYISPTVWAWKESRVKTIKKYVDKLFVILPF
jgi:lipid-A-disaccharide synthase